MKNYLKTSAFVIAISLVALFSKQIQDILVSEYNKGVTEMQKHTIYPLGA